MWTEKKRAFIIDLCLSLVIYFEIRAKACYLLIAFMQNLETCSLEVSLLSIKTPNNFLEELLLISMSSILVEASSFEVSRRWDLSELAFRNFIENQLKTSFSYVSTLFFNKNNFIRTKDLVLAKKIKNKLRTKPGLLLRRTQEQSA